MTDEWKGRTVSYVDMDSGTFGFRRCDTFDEFIEFCSNAEKSDRMIIGVSIDSEVD